MNRLPTKKKFIVEEHETIDQCLDRMKREGYTPFRRMEEPIFQEVITNGMTDAQPCGRKITFEGRLIKSEH